MYIDPPLISIVTPSFNQGQFIEETIISVLNQTYKHIQYIVVDGGSTDTTMDVLNKFKDKIDIIIHEKDNGQTDAINKGFKMAQGELVGWINSDDILYPNCVEKIVDAYKCNRNYSIFYNCQGRLIDAQGKVIREYQKSIATRDDLLNTDYDVIQQGSFYRGDLIKLVDYLDEDIHYCMDLDLWLRLLNHGPVMQLNHAPLAAFRIWGETKTATGGVKFLKNIRHVLRRHGASPYSRNMRRIYWYWIKHQLKRIKL